MNWEHTHTMGIKVLRLQEIVSNTRHKQRLEKQNNVQPQINLQRRRGQNKADVLQEEICTIRHTERKRS